MKMAAKLITPVAAFILPKTNHLIEPIVPHPGKSYIFFKHL